jgi:hypothetical protein
MPIESLREEERRISTPASPSCLPSACTVCALAVLFLFVQTLLRCPGGIRTDKRANWLLWIHLEQAPSARFRVWIGYYFELMIRQSQVDSSRYYLALPVCQIATAG